VWIAPWSATLVVTTTAFAGVFGWLVHPWLLEYDRRVRTHVGALARYYLEAFLGATSLSAHGAHGRLMQAQEAVVVRWARAQLDTHRLGVLVDAVQATTGFGLAWWLVVRLGAEADHAANALLLAYWALRLPAIGQGLASMARTLPGMLIATERLLEPLQSPEERAELPTTEDRSGSAALLPPTISMRGVAVRMGGHAILEDLDLEIAAGSHVALVGTSGSGKSTMLGLLLGWNRPAQGEIRVDGALLDGDEIARLRQQTAWVDPSVQLWNQSLLANVTYRADPSTRVAQDVGLAIEAAELQQVLQRLPHGLQTPLGENGALISGGEGQRARFGRALTGPPSRLVLLDEPFRGLDNEQRRRLLARAREFWADATLLCATHDVEETLGFDRVLVVESGRIVEDGDPRALAADPSTRYAEFIATERTIAAELWGGREWKRLRVEGGRVLPTVARRRETMRLTAMPRAAGGTHAAR
jgi:ABC-type transport system involved in cytochrome bd biosynthesis fused ATPase/permease subunit